MGRRFGVYMQDSAGWRGIEESAPSFGHLRILPADLSKLGSGLRVDRRRALLCYVMLCYSADPVLVTDGSERRRSLVRVARPSGWDLANPYIRERMSGKWSRWRAFRVLL